MVEVDSEILVRLVSSNEVAGWPLCNVLRKIRRLLAQLGVLIAHIFREANGTVDKLAGLSLSSTVVYESVASLPRLVRGSLRLDSQGFSVVRTRSVKE